VHDAGQVIADRVQVPRVFQPHREHGHGPAGVIPGLPEPPGRRLPHPPPKQTRQSRDRQHAGGRPRRRSDPGHPGGRQHQPGAHPGEQAGHDRAGQGPR